MGMFFNTLCHLISGYLSCFVFVYVSMCVCVCMYVCMCVCICSYASLVLRWPGPSQSCSSVSSIFLASVHTSPLLFLLIFHDRSCSGRERRSQLLGFQASRLWTQRPQTSNHSTRARDKGDPVCLRWRLRWVGHCPGMGPRHSSAALELGPRVGVWAPGFGACTRLWDLKDGKKKGRSSQSPGPHLHLHCPPLHLLLYCLGSPCLTHTLELALCGSIGPPTSSH